MFVYKDFNYVNHIFSLPYKQGRNLYLKCLGRLKKQQEEKLEAKQWDLYLFDIEQRNFEGSFNDYREKLNSKNEDLKMSDYQKEQEENRIKNDVQKIIDLDRRRNKNV